MNPTTADQDSLEFLRDAVGPVCAVHPVARLEVFGSRAEGTARPGSDVDLLVEFVPGANAGLFESGAPAWCWRPGSPGGEGEKIFGTRLASAYVRD